MGAVGRGGVKGRKGGHGAEEKKSCASGGGNMFILKEKSAASWKATGTVEGYRKDGRRENLGRDAWACDTKISRSDRPQEGKNALYIRGP